MSLWPHFWPSLYADALQKVTISKLSTMCPSFTPVRGLSLLFPVITNYSRVKLVLIQIRAMIFLLVLSGFTMKVGLMRTDGQSHYILHMII